MNNFKIANELLDIKLLLELNGDYNSASRFEHSSLTIFALEKPIEDYANLNFLPDDVANEVSNIISLGYSPKKEFLESKTPKVLKNLSKIPSIRTSDVISLYKNLDIDSITDLEKSIKNGLVRKKFGEKFEEHLRRSLFYFKGNKKELSLFYACSYGNAIKMALREFGAIEIAGSVRRGKEIVDNIDFVFSFDEDTLIKNLIKNFDVKRFVKKGNLISFKDIDDFELKFFRVDEKYFYAGLQYYTGSKQHNKSIQEIAKAKGFDISKEGFVLIEASSEEEFYERLNLSYVPPEIREGEEEIDLAINNSLPKVIDLEDIKGDLHVHSNFSDGTSSIAEIKEEASFLGYEYIAITDHSKSLRIANGLSNATLRKEFEIIDRLNSYNELPYILKGIEAEIKFDGSLDIDDEFLGKFDFVIGGLHQFSLTRLENTQRIKKAMKSGLMNTLAHPTNRLIFVRKSIDLDIEEIFKTASKFNIALEINLFPNRIDLNTGLIKEARRSLVKYFTIGTDSHNKGHLNFMKYGVKILKRAWVRKEEVLNTYSLEDIREVLWTQIH